MAHLTAQTPTLSTKPIRVAVVGGGAISKHHLAFLASRADVEIVGICDISNSNGQYAVEQFGVAQRFTEIDHVLELKPDVVHILTPPQSHVALVKKALDAGAHVICEKPLGSSANDVQWLLNYAASSTRLLVETQNYRFNPEMQQLLSSIESGELGDVRDVDVMAQFDIRAAGSRFADLNMRSSIHDMPAGALHDFITHLAYLALAVIPEVRFDSVVAHWNNHGGGDLFRFDDLDATCIAIGPNGPIHVRIRFSCHSKPEQLAVHVRGSAGASEVELMNPTFTLIKARSTGKQLTPITNQVVNGTRMAKAGFKNLYDKVLGKSPYVGLTTFLGQTYDALISGATQPVTSQDVYRAAAFVDALIANKHHEIQIDLSSSTIPIVEPSLTR